MDFYGVDNVKGEVIEYEGRKLKVVEVLDEGISKEEREFNQWLDKAYCLKAVEADGLALQYVKEQDKDICLKAVEADGDALRYVKDKKTWLKLIKDL